jgi:hypothetical protein
MMSKKKLLNSKIFIFQWKYKIKYSDVIEGFRNKNTFFTINSVKQHHTFQID